MDTIDITDLAFSLASSFSFAILFFFFVAFVRYIAMKDRKKRLMKKRAMAEEKVN